MLLAVSNSLDEDVNKSVQLHLYYVLSTTVINKNMNVILSLFSLSAYLYPLFLNGRRHDGTVLNKSQKLIHDIQSYVEITLNLLISLVSPSGIDLSASRVDWSRNISFILIFS